MLKKARLLGLGILSPLIALAITACPFGDIDAIIINFGPGGPVVTGTFTFTASPPIADSNVVVYKWNFGDGTMAEGKVVVHHYPGGGRYTVELIVLTTSPSGNNPAQYVFTKTIDVLGILAFTDEDSFGDDAIFIVNSDGTGLSQVTDSATLGVTDLDEHDINSFGQIVYACENLPVSPLGGDDDQLCVINADGTGDKVITGDPERAGGPRINDLGQIVYVCEDSGGNDQICKINFDGTGHKRLTSGGFNTDPEINNLGQVAYICEDSFATPQICVINFSGTGKTQLTNNINGFIDAEINDLGMIAFECLDNLGDDEICRINFTGGQTNRLTDSDCCTDFFNPEVNQFGKIAFKCDFFGPPPPPSAGSDPFQACVIRSDGSGFTVAPDTGDILFSILDIEYSGTLIASVCGNNTIFEVELCVFDDQGTSFARIVSGLLDLEDISFR